MEVWREKVGKGKAGRKKRVSREWELMEEGWKEVVKWVKDKGERGEMGGEAESKER